MRMWAWVPYQQVLAVAWGPPVEDKQDFVQFTAKGSKNLSRAEDITITTTADGSKLLSIDLTSDLEDIVISENGYYFQLFRKL